MEASADTGAEYKHIGVPDYQKPETYQFLILEAKINAPEPSRHVSSSLESTSGWPSVANSIDNANNEKAKTPIDPDTKKEANTKPHTHQHSKNNRNKSRVSILKYFFLIFLLITIVTICACSADKDDEETQLEEEETEVLSLSNEKKKKHKTANKVAIAKDTTET